MTDMLPTIAPKSDQINADDLLGGPITITITKVSGNKEPEQPISIGFEGDRGKPYKPCKSMRRVMVKVWGPDGAAYVGRSMTLYRDDGVMFGGQAVGGIRISHMSGLDKDVTMALTASKAQRKPFTVRPLRAAESAKMTEQPKKSVREIARERLDAATNEADVQIVVQWDLMQAALRDAKPEIKKELQDMIEAARKRIADNVLDADDVGMQT